MQPLKRSMQLSRQKLNDVASGVKLAPRDVGDEKTYNTLKDTFNAFDKDGSNEMGYEEYNESWKFLNRPGSDADIKKAFEM